MSTPSPIVFVSHIHEESPLGEVVKEWVEDVFSPHNVTAWLSSDRQDSPAGRKWRDEILGRLQDARVLVSLISSVSLVRPWVNIEVGAAWVRDIRVIPLCHSGQTFATLPPPFSDFQGFGLDQDDAAHQLLGGVADGLGVRLPKKIHFEDLLRQLRAAEGRTGNTPAAPASALMRVELPQEQVDLLIEAAHEKNRGGDGHVQFEELAVRAGVSPAAATYHIKQLVGLKLLHEHWYQGGPFYSLSAGGSGWLLERDLMPK